MLDISFSELLMCFLVALVVLGPEKLPRVARGIGRWTGQAKAYMRNLSAELDRESHASDLRKQMDDARRIFNEESTSMKREFDGVADHGRSMLSDHPHPIHEGERPSDWAAPAAEAPAAPVIEHTHAAPSIDAPSWKPAAKTDPNG
ncbi:Sec-independent protein translocase protein TatB [Nevskia sp.]|uniref:Sec-independent protein translocase protein TatB n=1 Tax=Nevskia sp. TaxID=1929292 RepID=UPI0025E29719|nr:Sec-independent protein translocase protein TatB [Nevskia sp.]